jgi:hypothetical protein
MEMPEGFKKFIDKYVTFPPMPEVDNELKAAYFLQEMAKILEEVSEENYNFRNYEKLNTIIRELRKWK